MRWSRQSLHGRAEKRTETLNSGFFGLLLLVLGCLVGMSSCSTPKLGTRVLKKIYIQNMAMRRPEGVGARFEAATDEEDYASHPLPDDRFDCRSANEFFSTLNLNEVANCLESSEEFLSTQPLVYRLYRKDQPYFELLPLDGKDYPACISNLIPQIPVPREIFFQAKEESGLGCYSARLPTEDEEFLKLKSMLHQFRLRASTQSFSEIPEIRAKEVVHLLSTWVVAPFLMEGEGGITSQVVVSPICSQCMGSKNLYLETDNLPPDWP